MLSLVKVMSGSKTGSVGGLGRVEMEIARGSSAVGVHVVVGHSNSSRGYVFSCLLPLLKDCLS